MPCASVMVIIVLLKVEAHMRDARRDVLAFAPADARCVPCAIGQRVPSAYFFLPAIGLGRALAGARIGVRALAADRQAAAMTQAAVAAEIHQPLDVHRRPRGEGRPRPCSRGRSSRGSGGPRRRRARSPAARPGCSTFSMISLALAAPMPWMYCSAMIDALVRRNVDASDTGHVRCSSAAPLSRPQFLILPDRETQKTGPGTPFQATGTALQTTVRIGAGT